MFSEDYQTEVTQPGMARADPQGRPDPHLRGIYENKDHAWYDGR